MKYFEVKKARIEIIPMIDIMFFLLVFFIMMSLHMIPSSGVISNLVKSSTATPLEQPKVVVSVDAEGHIEVDEHQMTPAQLTALLQKGNPAQTIVTIVGTKQTSMQQLMDAMDACRAAGVTQIGLAAQKQ
jgi:biopolymer transport protein ExbD